MKTMGICVRGLVVGVATLGWASGAGRTQATPRPAPVTIPGVTQSGSPLDPAKEAERSPFGDPQEKQAKQRNDDRQRRLVADTERLLALATSLHEDVAKTNKNVLSLDVVRRADEIEKLARGVKERMKG